jgi:hypothetical protein
VPVALVDEGLGVIQLGSLVLAAQVKIESKIEAKLKQNC